MGNCGKTPKNKHDHKQNGIPREFTSDKVQEFKPSTLHAVNFLNLFFKRRNIFFELQQIGGYSITKPANSGEWMLSQNKYIIGKRLPRNMDTNFLNSFKESILKYIEENPNNDKLMTELLNPRQYFGVGDKFNSIHRLNAVFGDETNESINHFSGQVICLYFWASWCDSGNMQKLKQICYNRQAEWGDKVRFVCVSLDKKKVEAIRMINTKRCRYYLEHFHVEDGWDEDHKLFEDYNFQGAPLAYLIDPHGVIVWTGDLATIELEENITQLLIQNIISYECYKKLKKYFVKALFNAGGSLDNIDFQITAEKRVDYSPTGNKSRVVCLRPVLNLRGYGKENVMLNDIAKGIRSQFSDSELLINVEFDDSSVVRKGALKILSKAIESSLLPEIGLEFVNKCSYNYDHNKQIVANETSLITAKTTISPTLENIKKVIKFEKSYVQLLNQAPEKQRNLLKNFSIRCQLEIGKQYLPFGLEDLLSEKTNTIAHSRGQILLMIFWSTRSEKSKKAIEEYEEILEKQKKYWGTKVSIIAISKDSSKENVVLEVEANRWTLVKHYYIGANENPVFQLYGIKEIPHQVLIDKEGKIVFSGKPKGLHLENEIKKLFDGGHINKSATPKINDSSKLVSVKTSKKLISECLLVVKNLLDGMDYDPQFGLDLKYVKHYGSVNGPTLLGSSVTAKIEVEVKEKDYKPMKRMVEKLKKIIGAKNTQANIVKNNFINLQKKKLFAPQLRNNGSRSLRIIRICSVCGANTSEDTVYLCFNWTNEDWQFKKWIEVCNRCMINWRTKPRNIAANLAFERVMKGRLCFEVDSIFFMSVPFHRATDFPLLKNKV